MQLIIPHDTRDDANLRWGGCYVRYTPEGGSTQLLYIRSIRRLESDRARIQGSIFNEGDGMWEALPEFWVTNAEIDTSHIKTGNIDIGNACRYVSKSRGSSYRLGVCDQRYSVFTPSSNALNALRYRPQCSFGSVVPKMYEPKFRTIEESLRLIMQKDIISSAVTSEISLGLTRTTKFLGLYKGTKLIGEYNHETSKAILPYKHKYFVEEVQEAGFNVELTEEPTDAARSK